jgi:hypothetical protein
MDVAAAGVGRVGCGLAGRGADATGFLALHAISNASMIREVRIISDRLLVDWFIGLLVLHLHWIASILFLSGATFLIQYEDITTGKN